MNESKSLIYTLGYLTTAGAYLLIKLLALSFVVSLAIFILCFAITLGLTLGYGIANSLLSLP